MDAMGYRAVRALVLMALLGMMFGLAHSALADSTPDSTDTILDATPEVPTPEADSQLPRTEVTVMVLPTTGVTPGGTAVWSILLLASVGAGLLALVATAIMRRSR